MNIIKLESGQNKYRKIFSKLRSESTLLVVWQLHPDTGKRQITESTLLDFLPNLSEAKFIFLADDFLEPGLPLYFYSEADDLIFKTSIKEMKSSYISVNFPLEIHMLEEPEVVILKGQPGLSTYWKTKRSTSAGNGLDRLGSDYLSIKPMAQRSTRDQEFLKNEWDMPTLDEEDKIYAEKRETPRAKPKAEKWVKVRKVGARGISLFKLYDLSRGGLSFIVIGGDEYIPGTEINVTGFEQFDLDDPLVGVVMSLRPVDETMIEYKIGVKFNEGQS